MLDETVTITSTKVFVIRVQESTSGLPPSCSLVATCSTRTCSCFESTDPKVKKIILRLPKFRRNCNVVPWWMKNLTPKYDQEKGIAYKKQIHETPRTGPSKCAAPLKKQTSSNKNNSRSNSTSSKSREDDDNTCTDSNSSNSQKKPK